MGHSGGVSSAVEAPSSGIGKSHEEQRTSCAGAGEQHRACGQIDRGLAEAATDVGGRRNPRDRVRDRDHARDAPLGGTVRRRSRAVVALQPSVLRLRRRAWRACTSHARISGRPRSAANIVKAVGVSVGGLVLIAFFLHYQGLSRFWVIALAVSTTLALIVEREIARRDLHPTPPAGQVAPPDRDRRHRRPRGAPAAHIPATSRPRLRGPRLRRLRRHRRARRRRGARHASTRSSASSHESGANGVVVSPSVARTRHQRTRAEAHRPRLPRRSLLELARHRHEPLAPATVRRPRDALHRAGHPPRMATVSPSESFDVIGGLRGAHHHAPRAARRRWSPPASRARDRSSSARFGSESTASRSR